MDVDFYKYHGAGNDFVMIDNREGNFPVSNREEIVQQICQRHFGVGSDGLILIQKDEEHDFYMEFYNPDGSQSFCGNGSRCAVMFAFHLKMIGDKCTFNSIHGINQGTIIDENVSLKMFDVSSIEIESDYHYINTGSPHYNVYVESVEEVDLIPFSRNIRYNDRFSEEGTNVNVIEKVGKSSIKVRTYERGVENETLSCGTGVTACAISHLLNEGMEKGKVKIETMGGVLTVVVDKLSRKEVKGITLIGPAKFIFKGKINV